MAFETLNPLAALWLGHGLRYLIRTEEAEFAESASRRSEVPIQGSQTWKKPMAATSTRRQSGENGADACKQSEAQAPPAQGRTGQTWQPLPQDAWPKVWQDLFAKTRRGLIAWTYPELGRDLLSTSQADMETEESARRAARSKVLQGLVSALKNPAGTHTFWPCFLDSRLEPELFWSGARALGCRGVIILGTDCAAALLGSSQIRAFVTRIFRTHKVMVLKGISGLFENNCVAELNFLRASIAQIAR